MSDELRYAIFRPSYGRNLMKFDNSQTHIWDNEIKKFLCGKSFYNNHNSINLRPLKAIQKSIANNKKSGNKKICMDCKDLLKQII